MAALWLTSRKGSMRRRDPSNWSAARFMPIELSPGEDVKIGPAWRKADARKRQPDRRIFSEHLGAEEAARLAQPAGVIREKCLVDDLGQVNPGAQRGRIDPLLADTVQVV